LTPKAGRNSAAAAVGTATAAIAADAATSRMLQRLLRQDPATSTSRGSSLTRMLLLLLF
jgi:hypothetical protein